MRERTATMNMRVNAEERAMMRALAEAEDMPASMLLRRWIRQRYEARFGEMRKAAGGSR
jgi:hypothetical protein